MKFFLPAPFLTQNSRPCRRCGGKWRRGRAGLQGQGVPGGAGHGVAGVCVRGQHASPLCGMELSCCGGRGTLLPFSYFGKNVWWGKGACLCLRLAGGEEQADAGVQKATKPLLMWGAGQVASKNPPDPPRLSNQ